MKKQKHPNKTTTNLQLKDGGIYFKKWVFFREDLILDIDYTMHFRWQKSFSNIESLKKNKN